MNPKPFRGNSIILLETALTLAISQGLEHLMIVTRRPLAWEHLRTLPPSPRVLVAVDAGIKKLPDLDTVDFIRIDLPDTSPLEWLEISLQRALQLEKVRQGERVLCLYPLASPGELDSLSFLQLKEKAEYVSVQKLARISDTVPVEVLSAVVDIAMEMAREGREGKPIGTMFVVGDSQRVMEYSRPLILNPFQGYPEDQRMITEPELAETVKEIAQIDGAFIIRFDGLIMSAGRYIDTPAKGVRLMKGLGARHMAAASISKTTDAVAVTVSASSRTVRVFRRGKMVIESKPLRGLWA
jgi:diadenylate cyclase